ncbi:hypothetical protein CKM354_001294500 [Cercospora kikuchii]|uniref:Uncharacterized protein n=1 Tax=Cercospora kikuchii TaxID=84275 RepID=A0A9P3FMY5_9PEZI|nr:uncharacterized protein CKM354_001294500 [Cercospora kikuchii]GIZ49928.1 hypothetical protein CKM354_001294500 [Cercospora kikuchii]
MANSHPYRQDDPVEATNARFWREYDAAQPADLSIRDELAARKSALRSIDEVQGEFEGDDYWALGADPNISGAEALARMRREGAERSECDPDPVEVVRMHGRRYFGDEDLDDNDADSDSSAECDELCDESDDEREAAEHSIPVARMGPATYMAHTMYGNWRITSLVAAFERLQEADDLEDVADESQELIDTTIFVARHARLPTDGFDAIFQVAQRDIMAREEERRQERILTQRRQELNQLDEVLETLAHLEYQFALNQELIKRENRIFLEGQAIWKRDDPEAYAHFKKFKTAARTSLASQYEGSSATSTIVLEWAILCWSIGVFKYPDFLVDSIRRLARLHYFRVGVTSEIHSGRWAQYRWNVKEDHTYPPWEESRQYRDLEAFENSADGAANEMHEASNSRYGYEPQPAIGGEALHPNGFAKFVEPKDVPFLRRLEIIRAGFDIRVVRHAQSLRDPERVRHLANPRLDGMTINSHRLAGFAVFAWIAEAVNHLAEDPHERTSEEKEARRLLCTDMINFSTTLNREKHVRKLMRLAIVSVLVPYSAFAGYHGCTVAIPPNSRPKKITQLEQRARARRAQIIMIRTGQRNNDAWTSEESARARIGGRFSISQL